MLFAGDFTDFREPVIFSTGRRARLVGFLDAVVLLDGLVFAVVLFLLLLILLLLFPVLFALLLLLFYGKYIDILYQKNIIGITAQTTTIQWQGMEAQGVVNVKTNYSLATNVTRLCVRWRL